MYKLACYCFPPEYWKLVYTGGGGITVENIFPLNKADEEEEEEEEDHEDPDFDPNKTKRR